MNEQDMNSLLDMTNSQIIEVLRTGQVDVWEFINKLGDYPRRSEKGRKAGALLETLFSKEGQKGLYECDLEFLVTLLIRHIGGTYGRKKVPYDILSVFKEKNQARDNEGLGLLQREFIRLLKFQPYHKYDPFWHSGSDYRDPYERENRRNRENYERRVELRPYFVKMMGFVDYEATFHLLKNLLEGIPPKLEKIPQKADGTPAPEPVEELGINPDAPKEVLGELNFLLLGMEFEQARGYTHTSDDDLRRFAEEKVEKIVNEVKFAAARGLILLGGENFMQALPLVLEYVPDLELNYGETKRLLDLLEKNEMEIQKDPELAKVVEHLKEQINVWAVDKQSAGRYRAMVKKLKPPVRGKEPIRKGALLRR